RRVAVALGDLRIPARKHHDAVLVLRQAGFPVVGLGRLLGGGLWLGRRGRFGGGLAQAALRRGLRFRFGFVHRCQLFFFGALLKFTAAFTSALKARASTVSPSRRSIARRVPPSRPALKSFAGSGRLAPRAKVSFTTCLY